jgi:hypothetical protein
VNEEATFTYIKLLKIPVSKIIKKNCTKILSEVIKAAKKRITINYSVVLKTK